jgi:hypothetical protein
MEAMKKRVGQLMMKAAREEDENIRLMIYSAHDVQVANVIEWIEPVGGVDVVDVPYGSNLIFEMYYDEKCIEKS